MSEEIAAADSLLAINAELRRALEVAMQENDGHQAQNAALVRELVYARAVVAAARCLITHTNRNECVKIDNALLDYDAAVRARET